MTTGCPNVEGKPSCQSEHESQASELLLVPAKARSLPSARDIFAGDLPARQQMDPATHAVQVLLAVQRSVIETFISPPVVRGGMSINGAHSHHWNFAETTAALGSFPCRGQERFAKVRAG